VINTLIRLSILFLKMAHAPTPIVTGVNTKLKKPTINIQPSAILVAESALTGNLQGSPSN
jgi:hypothetical protein